MHNISNALRKPLFWFRTRARVADQKRLWSTISFPEHELQFILGLYEKYQDDLRFLRKRQRRLYSDRKRIGLKPQLGDLEAEITYLRIREFKPTNVVEISPASGWSTSWILHAVKDNGTGTLHSYDLVDDCVKVLASYLSCDKWLFHKGDVRRNAEKLPSQIDYLFIDSDHSADFARWYLGHLFPLLGHGTHVSAHDILKYAYEPGWGEESSLLCKWLAENRIPCFTASRALKKRGHSELLVLRKKLGLHDVIHPPDYNSMIFFTL